MILFRDGRNHGKVRNQVPEYEEFAIKDYTWVER
jgi:hypothetical protein